MSYVAEDKPPASDIIEMKRDKSRNNGDLEMSHAGEGSTVSCKEETCDVIPDDYVIPDGGWGWVCVIGCFIVHIFIGGYPRSFGLIYQHLIKTYHSSAAVTAWVGGATGAIRMGFSPVANFFVRKYGARKVVFTGGLILGIGNILTSYADSTESFFFSYSFLGGIGGSLIYSPSLVVIGQYFSKKRSIAMSLATAGSGVGSFIFPQLMVFLFSSYGFKGGLFILGALHLNCCISGLIYRPLYRPVPELRSVYVTAAIKDGSSTEDRVKGDEAEEDSEHKHKKSRGIWRVCVNIAKGLDISVWKDARFVFYAVSQGLSIMSYLPISTFIPAIAEENGLTEGQAITILSLMAIGDTLGRLCSGFIFDLKCFYRIRYVPFSACLICSSVMMLMWPHLYQFKYVITNAVVFSVIVGVTIAQRTNILCDMVGTDRLSGSHGMLVFFQGVSIFIGPFIGGKLRDIFGNYDITFLYMACVMLTAGLCSLTAGVLAQRRRAREVASMG